MTRTDAATAELVEAIRAEVKAAEAAPRILVGPDEAARRLSISRAYLYTLVREGRVPSRKVGKRRLFSVSELEQFATQK